jgi:hypothetical protein
MRRVAMACALLGTTLIFASLEGCEALVGSTVNDIACVDVPGACPKGQACVHGMCAPCTGSACQLDATADVVAESDGRAPPPMDAGPMDVRTRDRAITSDAPVEAEGSTLLALGSPCTSGPQCQSGLCGNSTLIVGGVDVGSGACTQPCCTSSDCGPATGGLVCYPSVGGNYCVDATLLGLPAPGSVPAGGECTMAASCRSGQCDTKNMICEDACCTTANCGGAQCQLSSFENQDEQTYNCGPSGGTSAQGANCSFTNCESNFCIGEGLEDAYCDGPCCSDSDCTSDDGNDLPTSCNWAGVALSDGGTEWIRSCTESLNPGGGASGATCSTATDCESMLCTGGHCTIPCCGTDGGIGNVCEGGTCGHASFTIEGSTAVLQVCIPD